MNPGQFTPKWRRLDDRLCQLVRAGKRPPEIAQALGVSRHAVVSRASVLRGNGVDLPRMPDPPRCAAEPITAPNVIPLVERALETDPAGAPPARVGREAWPLHVAAYVANVELNCSTRTVGRLINRDRKLVAYAVRRIEERRDEDPAFDAFLERLGDQARELAA